MNNTKQFAATTLITFLSLIPISSKAQTDLSKYPHLDVAKNWSVRDSAGIIIGRAAEQLLTTDPAHKDSVIKSVEKVADSTITSSRTEGEITTATDKTGVSVQYYHSRSYVAPPHITVAKNVPGFGNITFNDKNNAVVTDAEKDLNLKSSKEGGVKTKTSLGINEQGKMFVGVFKYEGHELLEFQIWHMEVIGKNAVIGPVKQ